MQPRLVAGIAAALLAAGAWAQALKAPNVVEVWPTLVTSGQPSADGLQGLAAAGFQVVINLAPPTVPDAVADEAQIVGRQGLVYVNVPVRMDAPSDADFIAVSGVLRALAGRKVLVHCQANMRASSMVFLHRVIALRENPDAAAEALNRAWKPDARWKAYIEGQLKAHGISYELL